MEREIGTLGSMEREFGIANREEWPTAANCDVVFFLKLVKSMQPASGSTFLDKLKTAVNILLQKDWHWRQQLAHYGRTLQ